MFRQTSARSCISAETPERKVRISTRPLPLPLRRTPLNIAGIIKSPRQPRRGGSTSPGQPLSGAELSQHSRGRTGTDPPPSSLPLRHRSAGAANRAAGDKWDSTAPLPAELRRTAAAAVTRQTGGGGRGAVRLRWDRILSGAQKSCHTDAVSINYPNICYTSKVKNTTARQKTYPALTAVVTFTSTCASLTTCLHE